MNVQVEVIGADRLRGWLLAAPERFDKALHKAAEEAGEVEMDAVKAGTPQLTGTLAGSVTAEVTGGSGTGGEVELRVGTTVRYGPFVERGTRQHGAAQHMFQHGAEAARPEVEGRFHNAVHSVADSFGNV